MHARLPEAWGSPICFAPTFQDGILDDLNPEERTLGMDAGFAWGKKADLVAVYMDRGLSLGMQKGIASAMGRSIPIEYRHLL